jgi:hypothetical protein
MDLPPGERGNRGSVLIGQQKRWARSANCSPASHLCELPPFAGWRSAYDPVGNHCQQIIKDTPMFSRPTIAIALCSLLAAAGCVNNRVYLKNPATGEVVKCGASHLPLVALMAQSDEAKCVDDYKEQGFVRVAQK